MGILSPGSRCPRRAGSETRSGPTHRGHVALENTSLKALIWFTSTTWFTPRVRICIHQEFNSVCPEGVEFGAVIPSRFHCVGFDQQKTRDFPVVTLYSQLRSGAQPDE